MTVSISTADRQTKNRYRTSLENPFQWIAIQIETMPLERYFYVFVSEENDSWFWNEEWQAGERAADSDYETGNYRRFDTIDDLISHLHAKTKNQERDQTR